MSDRMVGRNPWELSPAGSGQAMHRGVAIRARARSWVELLFWVVALWMWGRSATAVVRHILGAANFSQNDWMNLDAIHFLGTFPGVEGEVFRPFTPLLFGVLHDVFRLDARGFALFFIGVNILAAVQLARLFHLVGFSWLAVTIGGLSTLISRATLEAFGFFTVQQHTVSRLLLVSAILSLLRRGAAERRSWNGLVYTGLALATHEQATMVFPLFFLCIAYRDGLTGVRTALRRRDVQAFVAVIGCYLLMHTVFLRAEGPHALGLRGITSNLAVFSAFAQQYLGDTFTGWTGLLLVAGSLYWLYVRRWQAARMMAFALGWAVTGFSLYFLALHGIPNYCFNVAEPGFGLLLGSLFDFMVRDQRTPLLLGVASVFALGHTSVAAQAEWSPRRDVSVRVMALIDEAVRESPSGLIHIIFVQDGAVNPDIAAPYLGDIGDDSDWNDHPIRSAKDRAHAVAVTYPGRRFRIWVLDKETAPYLCVRSGDAAIRVLGRDRTPVPWDFVRIPIGCGAAWQEPPPATHAAPGAPSPEFFAMARQYWQAYAAFEDAAAVQLYQALESRSATEAGTAVRRMIEAVRATRP
jgi:hypothetical protein